MKLYRIPISSAKYTFIKPMLARILTGFFFIIFTLLSIESNAQNDEYTLLWRVEGNGLKAPSYLFGTMHVKDARAFNFSDSVLIAIEKTAYFALELHPDSLMNEMFNKLFEENLNFKQLFKNDEYEQLSQRIKDEKGFDLDQMNVKNPIMIRSLLTPSLNKEDDKQTFVDAYLYGIAKTYNKKIFGLEAVKDQTEIFFGASKQEQRQKLLEVLNVDSASYVKGVDSLALIYSTGNLNAIQKIIERSGLIDSIMIKRNRVMENSLRNLMHKAPTFAAVGCAHLPGKNGLIDILRQAGYTVTAVESSFTGVANRYKIDPLRMEWKAYRDENLGFEIKTPGILIPTDIVPGMNMLIFPDLITEAALAIMTIDLRGSKQPINEDELIDEMIDNFTSSDNYKSLKKKNIIKNGLPATEVSAINGDDHMLIHFILQNKILYFQFANSKRSFSDKKYFDYFFNSFKSFEPQHQKQTKDIDFVSEHGAYTVRIPVLPKETKITYNEPSEYDLHMAMATDMPRMANYLISYNDFPVGYYIDSKEDIFEEVLQEYKNLGQILSPPDTIWLDGYEGREYEIMLNDTYYAVCRVYIRGNRIYRVIHQNLDRELKELENKDFFASFSFIPFIETELEDFRPDNANFTAKAFPEFMVSIDSSEDHSSYFVKSTSYYFKDSNSGGVYMLEYNDLSDYFKINNIDSFYLNEFKEKILSWTDSLISFSNIKIDGVPGKEALTYNKITQQRKRHRLWLDDKKLFYLASFVAEELLMNEVSDAFFTSYLRTDEINLFDIYASKSKNIIEDLISTDSAVYRAALGAMYYYEFTSEDLPLIYEALKKDYTDDDREDGSRAKMAQQLAAIGDSTTLKFIEALYKNDKTPEALKISLLTTINNLDDIASNELFIDLFFTQAPENLGRSDWKIFKPFNDSIELAQQHFDKLLLLLGRKQYRSNILSLASNMIDSDSLSRKFIEGYYEDLTQFAFEDINNYLTKIDTSENTYFYNYEIDEYLHLINNIQNKAFAEKFTNIILDSKIRGSMRTRAITARIFHNLNTDKAEIATLLDAMETRYEIMKALYLANKHDKIPKSYRKQEEFAKLCMYEYLAYDGDYPSEIKLLGHIMVEESKIFVFSFYYSDDEENQYIGLSRISPSSTSKLVFNDHKSYVPWELLEQDWRSQAKLYVTDLVEYGY